MLKQDQSEMTAEERRTLCRELLLAAAALIGCLALAVISCSATAMGILLTIACVGGALGLASESLYSLIALLEAKPKSKGAPLSGLVRGIRISVSVSLIGASLGMLIHPYGLLMAGLIATVWAVKYSFNWSGPRYAQARQGNKVAAEIAYGLFPVLVLFLVIFAGGKLGGLLGSFA